MTLWWHYPCYEFVSRYESVTGQANVRLLHPTFRITSSYMNRIRSFLYRFPRFTVDCRMDFIREDSIVLGTCYDLSQSGLRGSFAEVVTPGSKGIVTLYMGDQSIEVQATVSSLRDDETRMRFQFASDKERIAMRDLLKEVAARVNK
jgi:hypothetical protein